MTSECCSIFAIKSTQSGLFVEFAREKNLWRWINPPLSLPVNQFYCLGVLLSQISLLIMETAVYKASLSSDVIVVSAPKSDPTEKSVMNESLKLILIFFYFFFWQWLMLWCLKPAFGSQMSGSRILREEERKLSIKLLQRKMAGGPVPAD